MAEGQTAVLTTAAQMPPERTDRVGAAAVIEPSVAQSAAALAAHARIARRVRDVITRTEPERNRAETLRIG